MGFWGNLFGGTFESNKRRGDELFADREWGEAKMAYERAIDRAGADEAARAEIGERLDRCRLELARRRIADADTLATAGELEEARSMLEDATQICDAPEIATAVEQRRERFEADAARGLAGEIEEMSEDELLAVLAGTWSEEQALEYSALPDRFREALLVAHDGDLARAAEVIAGVLEDTALDVSPRYARFELGRILFEAGRFEEAVAPLERFVDEIGAATHGKDHALDALFMLARALLVLDRPREADAALVRATTSNPENHVAFLNLGVFLREQGELERSLVALEKAIELMGQLHPDFRVIREIGYTYLAMGKKKEAEQSLFAVIEHQASQGAHDQFDPEAAIPLAKLYEERGDLEKAADLFRHLAVGHDTANLALYNLEAARLLALIGGQLPLQERYLTRAAELADNPELRARIADLAASKAR